MMSPDTPAQAGGSGLARLGRVLTWFEETLIAYLLLAMTMIAFVNYIAREFFAASFGWALELTLNVFLYLIMFGMAYVLRKGLHIGIDVFVNLFQPRTKKGLTLIGVVITLIYGLAFVWVGIEIVLRFTSSEFLLTVGTEELDIPHWFTYSFMTLCYAYFTVTVFVAMIAIIRGKRQAITASHEAEEDVVEADLTNASALDSPRAPQDGQGR